MPMEVELLVGIETIAQRVRNLHREATTRLWWGMDASPVSRLLLARAVDDPGLLDVGPGVEVRLVLDTALLVDAAGIIDLSSFDKEGVGSFETRLPPTLEAVATLLDEVFSLSTPYGATMDVLSGSESVPLDERDRQILSVLTVGASDQLVARQVGVWVRTVERRVRYLMEHLGAATRFQAGVQAARRGWV